MNGFETAATFQTRVAAVVVLAAVLCIGTTGSAAAAQSPSPLKVSWGQAAAIADYPVYKLTRALRLKPRVTAPTNDCVPGGGKVMVVAGYGRRSGKGPQFGLWQANPFVCGNPGESLRYRKVRIRHRSVWVYASCETYVPKCALVRGRSHSWLVWLRLRGGSPRTLTQVELIGSHMTVRQFIRAARSLRRVKPASTVPLSQFLSSDGSVWCSIGRYTADDRWCASDGMDEFGASVALDGTVHLCGTGQASPYDFCTQNWNPNATRLKDGASSDFGGYVCTDHAGAVTCTVKAGAGAGHGFVVSSTGSSGVSPP